MREKSNRNRIRSRLNLFRNAWGEEELNLDFRRRFCAGMVGNRGNHDSPWLVPFSCLWALVFALWLPVPVFAAQPQSADAIVDSLQKNYDATTDFTADFQQQTDVKSLNRSLKTYGKLYFKRPGKMLWQYSEPKGEFALADGKNLYFYQPDQNQVIKSPLKNAFRSDVPLSFLLGLGNLKKDFNATLTGSDDKQYTLRLEPKNDNGGFSEVLLGVAKPSFDIVSVTVRDATGNLTTIRLSQLRKGVGLKDSLFTLELPKGADVVELGQ